MNERDGEASGSRKPGGRARAVLDRCTTFGVLGAVVATAASFLAGAWWVFELFTHFPLQLAAGSIALLAVAALRRRSVPALLALVIAAVNVTALVPYVWPAAEAPLSESQVLRVLVANVSKRNADHAAFSELIRTEAPDVIGLVEASQRWVDALSGIDADYPYRVLRPEDGAYGLVLYSRLPVTEAAGSPYFRDGVQAAITADVRLGEVRATLLLAHLMAPIGSSYAALRNEQLTDIAGRLRNDANATKIVIGDLNITPWSPWYRLLEAGTGLSNAARGRGYKGTWPALPALPALFRIPIDHCLVSDSVAVSGLRVGPDIGSDHLPLIVDLVVSGYSGVNSAR